MNSASESKDRIIYFDNAATSFPKPEPVIDAVTEHLRRYAGNPGRAGHFLSIKSGETVFAAREAAASLFGISDPMRVLFCASCTDALNLAILGLVRQGDHVLTTSMEHNSSIRPLGELEARGEISLGIVPCSREGRVDTEDLKRQITPKTRMIVVNHASNAFGTVQPLDETGRLCRERGLYLIADCAQSAGIIPLHLTSSCVDMAAFSGHKGLCGPTGTGGLAISDGFDISRLNPVRFGGTGSYSEHIYQPPFYPDRFESGTLNACGLAGMLAGIRFVAEHGIDRIAAHKNWLVRRFITGAETKVKGFNTYVPPDLIMTGVVSFTIDGIDCAAVAQTLSDVHGIMSRPGIHCAPLAHRTMGTFPVGTVRFSFGLFNTGEEVDTAVEALSDISAGLKR